MNPDLYLNPVSCEEKPICCDAEESLLQRLVRRKTRAERELVDLNAAIEAMNDHPDICDVLVKISRVSDRLR